MGHPSELDLEATKSFESLEYPSLISWLESSERHVFTQ